MTSLNAESVEQALQPSLFPSFLLPSSYKTILSQVKSTVESQSSRSAPKPFLPKEIVYRLLQNAYDGMRESLGPLPFLRPLDEVLLLVDAQYATVDGDDTRNSSGAALANAVIALAIRHKMAAGAESHIRAIATAYYQNASLLLHELLLRPPTHYTAQALRAMAAFAQGVPDSYAAATLLMNAEEVERARKINKK